MILDGIYKSTKRNVAFAARSARQIDNGDGAKHIRIFTIDHNECLLVVIHTRISMIFVYLLFFKVF